MKGGTVVKDKLVISGNNPILNNHKIYGQKILPGLSYIDMLYQFFCEYGYDYRRLELCNLSIYNPLIVGDDYDVLLNIQCTEIKAGCWSITVEGQEQSKGMDDVAGKLYITAEMHLRAPCVFEETLDINRIKDLSKEVINLEEIYEQCRMQELVHTGYMKAEGMIYHMEEGILSDICVGKNASQNTADTMFHPNIIDGSGISSNALLSLLFKDERRLFLPLLFESFRASELLQRQCIAWIQTSDIHQKNELLYLSIDFFNQLGKKVAELKNLTCKLVRDAGSIKGNRKELQSSKTESDTTGTITDIQKTPVSNSRNNSKIYEMELFLRNLFSDRLKRSAEELDTQSGYYEMGLDSSELLGIVHTIEKSVNASLNPTLLFEYSTISELAEYLADNCDFELIQTNAEEPNSGQGTKNKGNKGDIAVIGIAGRYPGAENISEFWSNLKSGKDCISEIPKSRWDWHILKGVKSPSGKEVSRWGGFIEEPDCFDPKFFRISPREAETMDPQERLFLEICWEVIEDAGYTPRTLVVPKGPNKRRNVGVFAGVMHKDYSMIGAETVFRGNTVILPLNNSSIANRVSYFCNFHGPSITIDTACSSSLTAIHLALESIRHGECEVALAGGVNLALHPNKYLSYGMMDLHSSNGYCNAFGNGGDGYVPGEGVGSVLLKPLSKAIEDHDNIYAVIKGSIINHGGTASGITVPSPVAQADLIVECIGKAGVDPRTISYLEAHGTGTSLGDPIEIQGLVKAFSCYTLDRQYCAIGSVKSNIGHAESAAGISGLSKVVLQLYHKTLVPSLHSDELNQYIDFNNSPFYVQHKTEEWKQPIKTENGKETKYPRRAGVSSFGATGSNAHIILEEYVQLETASRRTEIHDDEVKPVIIPLSARNKDHLKAYAVKLLECLKNMTEAEMSWQSSEMETERLKRALRTKIRTALADIIHVEKETIEEEQEWGEYGLEPIHLIQAIEGLMEEQKVEVNTQEIIHMNSITAVGDYLAKQIKAVAGSSNFEKITVEEHNEKSKRSSNIISLLNLAFTLQVGREAMEERVAFVVEDINGLKSKLQAFIIGIETIDNCWSGQVRRNKEAVDFISLDQDFIELAENGDMKRIAQMWINGYEPVWERLYDKFKPSRISLPTYPFAKERYWISEIDTSSSDTKSKTQIDTSVHTHINQNDSSSFEKNPIPETPLLRQEFSKTDTSIDTNTSISLTEPLVGNIILTPIWDVVPIEKGGISPKKTDMVLVIGGDTARRKAVLEYYPKAEILDIRVKDTIEETAGKLKACGTIEHIIWIAPKNDFKCITDDCLVESQDEGVIQVFRIIKALLRLGYGTKNLGWTLFTTETQPINKNEKINPTHSSIYGLTGSMAKEYLNWNVRLVDLEDDCELPVDELFALPYDRNGNVLVYRGKEWYHEKLVPVQYTKAINTLYKEGGVYVLVGGAGGIGEILSEYLIRMYQAKVVWIGRREISENIQAKIDRLALIGTAPLYISADAANQKTLRKAYDEIKQKYGKINGIVHSAIVLLDQSLANMEEERFRAGLIAKVDVSVRMVQVFHNEPLDFIVFFSSINSFAKAAGQSNYAAGCTFKDIYAHQLSKEWLCEVKVINWGYWGSAGVVASKEYQERLAKVGLGSIEHDKAMEALETLLAGPVGQIAVCKTTKLKVIEQMNYEELMKVYPKGIPLDIGSVQKRIPKRDSKVLHLKLEKGMHNLMELEGVLCKLLWGQLQSIGLFKEKKSEIANYKTKFVLLDLYYRWLEESIAVLERKNFLIINGNSCVVMDNRVIDIDEVWKEWEQKKSEWLMDPRRKSLVDLLEVVLRSLPEVLTGKKRATDIIFPNSSMKLVEGIYKNNAVADYFNEILANTAIAYIEEVLIQDPTAQIRLFEIGAGTGGTSITMFQKLQPYRKNIKEYCYTDVSKAFLIHAEKEYGAGTPYLTYKVFNVEEPIERQGIDIGGYDIVIATNVLHATQNIRNTIRNSKAVLKNNGLLLVNEMSKNSLFTHLTFGLLDGWWLYKDPELRIPGCPGLLPNTWKTVLEGEGFQSVFYPAQSGHELGQQLIAAVSDGTVRQKCIWESNTAAHFDKRSNMSSVRSETQFENPNAWDSEMVEEGVEVSEQIIEDHIKDAVIENLSKSLKINIKEIDLDESFADYGLDSITGVHLVQMLNQTLEINLETTNIFDYSSVNRLTAYIFSNFRDKVKAVIWKSTLGVKEKNKFASEDPNKASSDKFPNSFIGDNVDLNQLIEKGSQDSIPVDPIAIIGMSGKFPKSGALNELWEHLSKGDDLVERANRWNISQYMSAEHYCDYGGFLEDIDKFDPFFFNISGAEAKFMDPQQRLFLEESWKALEDAGYVGDGIQGRLCGVYVGVGEGGGGYCQVRSDSLPAQAMWGNADSVIPARIAYYLDLQGPAVAINTACSSSLVAIHLACQGLRLRETELAVAGGVFIQSFPEFYIAANRAGMLSRKGRCFTFDERADGFVPGEGVGVVILKRLEDAVADGDHIYGVIRGSGINQDGTTNGITAPSAKSQERLERQVYDTFHIDPEKIQVVEAHGTGTKLGDPIEITALTKAFKNYTNRKGYCAIGSIKTNIGHTSTAAGVAGVLKVLLSMQKKQIPPSLNYVSENLNIRFEDSPFYVNTALKNWDVENGAVRCAAVSAFGFSGTNAHLVIEELPKINCCHTEKPGYLIVLSARTSEQLKRQVEQLLDYIEQEPEIDCGNMSYTLLVGRKHFTYRFACITPNLDELVVLLKEWLNKSKVPQIYVSDLHEKDHKEQVFSKEYGNRLIQNCNNADNVSDYLEELSRIADLYVKGYSLQYAQLFSDCMYSRISLPTYPFDRERYWIPDKEVKVTGPSADLIKTSYIHPLLHLNTSDFTEQRYSSTFTGKEIFFSDNSESGRKVIPPVFNLEMSRAAVELATKTLHNGVDNEGYPVIKLHDIVWDSPIIVDEEEIKVHIGLSTGTDGEISYEIYSKHEGSSTEPIVHFYGKAVLKSVLEEQRLDIPALKKQCNKNQVTHNELVSAFEKSGIEKDPGYMGIELLHVGKGQVLAKLSLPDKDLEKYEPFMLYPWIVDSALKTSSALFFSSGEIAGTDVQYECLPYTIQEVEIIRKCTSSMWAFVQVCDTNSEIEGNSRINIDLCDNDGIVCVRMKGVDIYRNLEPITQNSVTAPSTSDNILAEAEEMLTFEEVWQEETLSNPFTVDFKNVVCFLSEKKNQEEVIDEVNTFINHVRITFLSQGTKFYKKTEHDYCINIADKSSIKEAFSAINEEVGEVDAVLYMWPFEDPSCIRDYSSIVNIIQVIASLKRKPDRLVLVSKYNNLLERCYLESWIGFERSLGLILPQTQVAMICQETEGKDFNPTMKELLHNIWYEMQTNKVQSTIHQDGKRYVLKVLPTEVEPSGDLIKPGGTYLITGGCGKLGMLFAQFFAKTKAVNLILTGRSQFDQERQENVKMLESLGSKVLYIQADVSDQNSMKQALDAAMERFGGINGVIHAAGIEGEHSILEKDQEDFQEVLAPKIKGTLILDELLDKKGLDFLCFFSSSAAILGDFGSCDYAVGNRFQMAYARYQNEKLCKDQRHTKYIVINWPLWKDGGMGLPDEDNTRMYLKSSGQRALETEEGLQVFNCLLSQKNIQHLVLVGQRSRINSFLNLSDNQTLKPNISSSSPLGKGRRMVMKGLSLEQCIEYDIKEHISNLLKISQNRLNNDDNFADFGFDSLSLGEFAVVLTKHYGIDVTPANFFGYPSIRKLTQYFLRNHNDVMVEIYIEEVDDKSLVPSSSSAEVPRKPLEHKRQRFVANRAPQSTFEPIAIIGMSGRFPQARNIEEMWTILSEGRNAVEEIPIERFDWHQIFGDPNIDPEKTSCKWCGCIPGVSEFDPLFFEISPREAEKMDPRQRLLLQEAWNALENAGYGKPQLDACKIGTFVGVEQGDYQLLSKERSITSSSNAVLAARLAYFLNLNGPVMAIDTACSSGLVAVHQAIQSLRSNDCDTAIAAGVNLLLAPESILAMSQAGMLSPDGKCFAFDKRANGIVPGEAVTVIVLKLLSKAREDGDPIFATIQGSGINYDGRTQGITAPSGLSQTKLLKEVYATNKINVEDIEYIVTHGTGTKLGDPVEINALYDTFKEYTNKQGFCAITSTKTNFGHTSAASGLVSLISLVEAFQNETIPASLHCEQENEYINWNQSPFYINKKNKPWPEKEDKNRVGAISAFGMSGTNVHMVLQSYPKQKQKKSQVYPPCYLLVFSAKTQEALEEKIQEIIELLQRKGERDLNDISFTLLAGRQHFNHRCAVVVKDLENAVVLLAQVNKNARLPNIFKGKVARDFVGQKAIEQCILGLLEESLSLFEVQDRYQEILYALGALYCQGYEIPIEKLNSHSKSHRISLPVYPFTREHYWIQSSGQEQCIGDYNDHISTVTSNHIAGELQRKKCILQKRWKSSEIVPTKEIRGTVAIMATSETMELAVFVSQCLPGSQIIDQNELDSTVYEWKSYSGLIDLVGCGKNVNEDIVWIKWIQQLIDQGRRESMMLLCVTTGLESYKNETINLTGALRVGLYRMLQSEYGYLQSRHMDASCDMNDSELSQLIATEYLIDSKEPEVCYREETRYCAHLEALSVDGKDEPLEEFPEGHVLWITGGTRGLGYLCAQHFVSKYGVKHLVLTGKDNIPPREEWESCSKGSTALSRKIQGIQALEEQGIQVRVLSVPFTDREAIENCVKEIKRDMGPIGGVVHCAGIGDGENPAFIRKPIEDIEKVISPKREGLVQLYNALKDEPVKFFVLFSSVSAIIPVLSAGQSDYAMGNAFMDYVAESVKNHCPMISIQWPSWKETGMGEVKSKVYEQTGLLSLTNIEGLELLDKILAKKLGSVVLPAVVNPDLWKPEILMMKTMPRTQRTDAIMQHPVTANKCIVSEAMNHTVETWLVNLFSGELRMDPSKLSIDTPFQNYGIDSILLAQILRKVNQKLATDLEPTILYEYPTIELLKDFLINQKTDLLIKALTTPGVSEVELNPLYLSQPLNTDLLNEGKIKHEIHSELRTVQTSDSQDIAVVGISCRFPGANDLDEYWRLLAEGHSAIGPVPLERWGYSNDFYAGMIDKVTYFDPKFFMLSEEDSRIMDPQALALLEESLKLWYHAGYTHNEIKGKKIGVYIGGRSQYQPSESGINKAINPIMAVGQNYLAANISHFFDLHGPSLVIDTACSSALVGMNIAIQALCSGELEAALVGGINILNDDGAHKMFQKRRILSKEPVFHIFDKRASGVMLGEGVGIVLIKTMQKALEDGDKIYAVIKGMAINNDGRTAGPATPNLSAHKDAMRAALKQSGISADEISYIEANGSGSEVTDLLELKAIQTIYRPSGNIPCGLGSVKPNIGHTLCAEGIAGFIKIVLMLNKKQLVPFLSGQQQMIHYDINSSPFFFCRTASEWTNILRVAAINCFADGGTNAHLILKEWDGEGQQKSVRFPKPYPELQRYNIRDKKNEAQKMSKSAENIWKQKRMEDL